MGTVLSKESRLETREAPAHPTRQSFRIPRAFQLHGIEYRVVLKDDLVARSDNTGEASYRYEEITLQSLVKGAALTPKRQEQVFCHELVHHVLREMHDKRRDDEAFVDLFASLLHQALTTAVYSDDTMEGRL